MTVYDSYVEKTSPPGFSEVTWFQFDSHAAEPCDQVWSYYGPASLRRENEPVMTYPRCATVQYGTKAEASRAAWRYWTHCALRKLRVQWAAVAPPYPHSTYFAHAVDVEKVEFGNTYRLLAMGWVSIHGPEPLWRFIVGWVCEGCSGLILEHNTIYNGHDVDQAMATFVETALKTLALRLEDA